MSARMSKKQDPVKKVRRKPTFIEGSRPKELGGRHVIRTPFSMNEIHQSWSL